MNEILEIAVDSAREAGGHKISRLGVRVGNLSGIAPDALSFAFDVAAQNTIASGATFTIDTVPGFELIVSSIEVD